MEGRTASVAPTLVNTSNRTSTENEENRKPDPLPEVPAENNDEPKFEDENDKMGDNSAYMGTKETKLFAKFRFVVLSCYRRLFTLVFIGNLAGFIYVMVRQRKLLDVIDACVANILVLGFARNPAVVNIFYYLFCSVPRWTPLIFRKWACKVYCYGGVHSGAGFAAFMWYLGVIGILTRKYSLQTDYVAPGAVHLTGAILGLAWAILVLLVFIIIAAYPAIRMKLHDYFELTHRFAGWAVVALFWPLLIIFSINAAHGEQETLGHWIIKFPSFWFLILTTLSIIHPWACLRRIKINTEILSPHAARVHFNHTLVDFGQGLSLAKHPLRDWHSFATFPDVPPPEGTRGTTKETPIFSCIVSKAGDWTAETIANPPTHIWKRSVPMYGMGYVMKVFKRVVMVTTGSGIGPCLSYVGDPGRPAMRVVWQTRSPMETYGQSIIDLCHELDPNPIIIDSSKTKGRTDMLPMILRLYKEFDAEAVCVISNPFVTAKLVYECEARGVAAFGPIFDS